MAHVRVDIEIPDEISDEDFVNFRGVAVSIMVEGVDESVVTPALLKVAEGARYGEHLERQSTSLPLGSRAMVEGSAALAARLSIIDDIMHLPYSTPSNTKSHM